MPDLSFDDHLQPVADRVDHQTPMGAPVTPKNTSRKSWGRGTTYNQRPSAAPHHLCLPSRSRSKRRAQKREPTRTCDNGLEDDVSKEIAEPKPRRCPSRRPRSGFHPRPLGVGEEPDDAPKGENDAYMRSCHQHRHRHRANLSVSSLLSATNLVEI
jgi:hypothetical protein